MSITAQDIKALRQALGWTQVELAENLLVSVRSVKNWEGGHTRPYPIAEAALRRLWRRIYAG